MNIPSSSSKSKYQLSGRAHPCPVCDRTHDADCKSAERGNLVYCHTNQREALNTLRNGYHYVGEVKRGAGWGLWVRNPADKKDRVPEKKTEYFYPDRSGKPFIKVIRQKGNNPEFWQEYWIDGEWLAPTKAKRKGHDAIVQGMKSQVPIYRYAEVQESIAAGKPIFIVEGEKCADALWSIGIASTTTIGGSGAYRQWGNYKDDLASAALVICPDRDEVGMKYAELVAEDFPEAQWLYAFPSSPLWKIALPKKQGMDIADWIEDGATAQDILNSVEAKRLPPEPVKSGKLPGQNQTARKLAAQYHSKVCWSNQHGAWFLYEYEMPGAWSPVTDDTIKVMVYEDLEERLGEDNFSASYRDGVTSLLKSTRSLFVDKWKSNNALVPFTNGVYDLSTGTFSDRHDPNHYFTYSLPREYTPEATDTRLIDQWLETVFVGDRSAIENFHCFAAALLRNMYHLQRFLHLVGEPGSGKSTAQKLMQALIGETNSTSTDLETLDNNRFEVSRFIGKKLCVMPDQSDYRGSIATFLRLTGNDSVRAERKNRDANNFLFEGLVCISSNGPVFLSRTGKELTRRQILLEFTQPVENSDPQFLKRLLSALPAYTNYLLNIPEADVVATLLRQSNTVTRSQWEAKKRVDSIAAWVDDCLLLNPDHQIKVGSDKNDASSLFGSYQIHCRNSGGEPKGLRDFSEMVLNLLKLIFPGRSFDKKRTRQGYVLTGVALRDEIDLDPFLTDVLFPHFGSSVQDGVGSVQDGCRVCVDPQPLLHKESVECVGLSDISLENSEKEEGNTEGEEGSDHDLKTDHSIQQNKDPNILHTLHKPSDTKGLNPAHHPTPTLHTTLHTLHTTQITIGSTVFYVGDQYPDLIDVPLVVRSIDRPYCVATMPDGSYTTNLFLTEVVLASASA